MKFINVSVLNNGHLLGIVDSSIKIMTGKEHLLTEEILHRKKVLVSKQEKFRLQIKNSSKSLQTEKISKLDKDRTSVVKGIMAILKANKSITILERSDAAKLLLNIIKPFGNFIKDYLDAETAAIRSLYKDYKAHPQAEAAALLLGCNILLDELNAINEQLDNLFIIRNAELSAIVHNPQAKANLISTYKELLEYIKAGQIYAYNEDIQVVMVELYKIHADYKTMLEKRKTVKANQNKPQDKDFKETNNLFKPYNKQLSED